MSGLPAARHRRTRMHTIGNTVPVRLPVLPVPLRHQAGQVAAAFLEALEPAGPGQWRRQDWQLESRHQARGTPEEEGAVAVDPPVAAEEGDGELDPEQQ